MSRYTVGMPENPTLCEWRYIIDQSHGRVGFAIPETGGGWTGCKIGISDQPFPHTFDSPDAVAAAWGEITGDIKCS